MNHYFKLLLQAFHDYPDKPRLFIRALDYCRTTGQRGTPQLLGWIALELRVKARHPLATYLGPLAVQTIARHIVTAAFDMSDRRLLARQRRAARSYLISLSGSSARLLLHQILDLEGNAFAGAAAQNALLAAVAYAAKIVSRPPLQRKMHQLAIALDAPELDAASSNWVNRTGSPIGVWTHWLDALRPDNHFGPGCAWQLTKNSHDPRDAFDRNSLRKGPEQMPQRGSTFWSQHPRMLKRSDAGWLLDQQRSEFPIDLKRGIDVSPVFRRLVRHNRDLEKRSKKLSVQRWVASLSEFPTHDPRVGEWTALEIVRQLVASVEIFPTGKLETLDELHPANILIPASWLNSQPPGNFTLPRWTWESWKQAVRNNGPNVEVVSRPISDFRRHFYDEQANADAEYLWLNRLRGIGLLLLGLCCHDFTLPAAWNIRGAERDVGRYVKSLLENATISSRTQAIIEAALLSRSAETALIRFNPQIFFGARKHETVNDTATDPPLIVDIQALLREISTAQLVLEARQISVLNHAARQLVPMNVFQLMKLAVPLDIELEDPE